MAEHPRAPQAPWAQAAGAGRAYVMSLCRGGRCTFRTTHFTIHSMPSRTPWLWRQWGQGGPLGPRPQGAGPTHPVRAEQAWVRQSRLPILAVQSLKAVLMSGMDRQVWGR